MILIGLAGLAGAGKTTIAMHLVERHGFARIRFADPLKAMLRTLGLTEAQVDGGQKEAPAELLGGKSPRWAMQTLGTEWGRDLIHPDLWVRAWSHAVVAQRNQCVVADDVRFVNEIIAIETLGGQVWRIERRGMRRLVHASETAIADQPMSRTLANDGNIRALLAKADAALAPMLDVRPFV